MESRLKECDQAGRQLQVGQRAYDQMLDRQKTFAQKKLDQEDAARKADEIQALLGTGNYAPEASTELQKLTGEMEALGFDPARLDAITALESQLRP